MTQISHIAIAVKDLGKGTQLYTDLLDCRPVVIKEVPEQGIKAAIFKPGDGRGVSIELITPLDENSTVARFLDQRGEGVHHVCVKVPDIIKSLAEFKKKGYRLINEMPREGAQGKKIAFIHPDSFCGVLIELEQE